MRILRAEAGEMDAGRPVKQFVRGAMGVSHRQLSALKARGGMRVNGAVVRANHLLAPGDVVELALEDEGATAAAPEPGEVRIVYEDEDLYIVDKPAPMACQCTERQPSGTLENRLAWRFRDCEGFVFRPLNRLDRGTSGLMAAAKHAHACRLLQRQLHTPSFVREYLAVAEGELTGEGTIDLPIAKAEGATVRRAVDPAGRPAVTHYAALGVSNGRTLVRLRLETGRTHQIRVHLAHIGHPVAGDFLYGAELPELPGRFALHSARIAFDHPISGKRIERASELPEELRRLL